MVDLLRAAFDEQDPDDEGDDYPGGDWDADEDEGDV